ncbi:MAG TPA: S8 family serine peptidase [Steroidobacteraceae bacterium]|nr:S8 family serine peptidase [Steroidobacteraceae bacterium]
MNVARFLLIALLGCALAHAESPVTFTLGSEEYRTIELLPNVKLDEWAERAQIEPLEHIPVPGGGMLIRFAMDEGVWRARRQALCTETGVAACDTDLCQTYYGPADEPNANAETIPGHASTSARMIFVPRAPDVANLFGENTTPLTDSAPGTTGCPRTSSSDMQFVNTRGDFSLPLPKNADRGCYEVIAASSCEARTRPLSDLLPEFEPRRLIAVIDLALRPDGVDAAFLNTLSAATGLRALDSTTLESINKAIVRFELPDDVLDAAAAVITLAAQPGIESAQHEYRHRTTAFDDPYAWMNYSIHLSGAERLHPQVMGAGIEIAVIDTGVDATHPELAARVSANLDVTGFGLSADRHGTAIAGIIAAEANNGVGAYGIAPQARIAAIKACQQESKNGVDGRCWSSTLAKALDAALKRDSRIINLSLSGPDDPLVKQLIEKALARSRLVIAAAGNGGPDAAPPFPASLPGVIAVTALDARERLYLHATRGDFVAVAAPGVEMPVPVPGATYPGQLSGTSMAAASASAVAALVMSNQAEATTEQVRAALEESAVSTNVHDKKLIGHGRIDACAALRKLTQDESVCASTITGAKP